MASGRMRRVIRRVGLITAVVLSASAMSAQAKPFDGFNEHFNLGRSAKSGVVCEAKRGFDDRLISTGARVWNVTCRGWSQQLGKLYQLPSSHTGTAEAAWRTALATTADCDFANAAPGTPGVSTFNPSACKTKAGGLDYVAFQPGRHPSPLAGEGMAAIADLLAGGLKYMAGAAPEPQAVAEQGADVSQVAQVHVDSLGLAGDSEQSADRRRRQAYLSGQGWQFSDAEAVFAALAAQANPDTQCESCAEAMYNFALNVSNKGRFAEADVYFAQANALAANLSDSSLKGLALNYLAAHARNKGDYDGAIKYADQAMAARMATVTLAPVVSGGKINLAWPANQIGWQLQHQVNPLTVGISTNWIAVPGSTGTNQISLPLDSTEASAFFRLVFPQQ